jgi:peptidoglycan LD-endopeptidase LytH
MGRGDRCGRPAVVLLALGLIMGAAMPPGSAWADDHRDEGGTDRTEVDDAVDAEEDAAREAERAQREAVREARETLDAARARLRSAESTLSSAREATRAARGNGSAAEGRRRVAEDALAPTVVAHQRAEEELREARLRVQAIREDLARMEDEVEDARQQLQERVVRAYKQGSVAAQTALPLLVLREVSTPGELATALKDLEVIADAGATRVDDLAEEFVHLEAQLVTAIAAREDAKETVAERLTQVEATESEAAAQRDRAASAEASLLAAVRRELEAERAVERARPPVAEAKAAYEKVAQEAADADAPPSHSARDGDDADGDDADGDRAGGDGETGTPDWVGNRERALARQRSVPAERRRAAEDWICPVEDSRFVNDWAFPRSQERRHEGTDVFASEGTPIVAAVDAEVVAVNSVDRFNGRSGFGGLTVSYEADGARYYNAHLQAIRPGLEVGDELEAGDVIGWVGRTGNARGTPPHLHLGVYVDDVAINPYPSLAVACADDGRETGDDEDAERVAELDRRRAARAAEGSDGDDPGGVEDEGRGDGRGQGRDEARADERDVREGPGGPAGRPGLVTP